MCSLQYPESVTDRPDIVARVFNQKICELKEAIYKEHVLGECVAYTYVVEFQKRGLPHVHMLVFLDKKHKLDTPQKIDSLISAEIPNQDIYPELYQIVKKFMIHGPCGTQNMKSPCMSSETNECTKKFPKSFNNSTKIQPNGYPLYKGQIMDNKFYMEVSILVK